MDQISSSSTPVSWIYKRDGRLVPFEPDKISRALFAVSEGLGRPDPFLARELADSVVHFLTEEACGSIPSSQQISELVAKVVRELGHPSLSRSYLDGMGRKHLRQPSERGPKERAFESLPTETAKPDSAAAISPSFTAAIGPSIQEIGQWSDALPDSAELARAIAGGCLRVYSLEKVFSRDLVAAHNRGLITLGGLDAPMKIAGLVVRTGVRDPLKFLEQIIDARQIAGRFIAIVGPEYHLASTEGFSVGDYVKALRLGLRTTGLRAVINLNSAEPPPSEKLLGAGPLFLSQVKATSGSEVDLIAEAICEGLLTEEKDQCICRIDWHIAKRDFAPEALPRVHRIARRILDGRALTVVMDRPRSAAHHAEGLKQNVPGLLLAVELNLPTLLRQSGQTNVDAFLQKTRSLARLAMSAGVQKRDFLRGYAAPRPGLASGFMLERARLLVVPVGLNESAEHFVNAGVLSSEDSGGFTRRIMEHLNRALVDEARHRVLDAAVESTASSMNVDSRSPQALAGDAVTWGAGEPPKKQAEWIGKSHSLCGGGTVLIRFPEGCVPTVGDLVSFLHFAWRDTSLVRVRFQRELVPSRQLSAPWDGYE